MADAPVLNPLKRVFSEADLARAERGGETYGARNLLGLAPVRAVTTLPVLSSCLLPILQEGFRAVRGLFFDKTKAANWPVQWHQDLSLAVQERRNIPGWGNWSVKRGIPHVQPPPEILAQMVTVRLHLDNCSADNGALRVISGSHRTGLLARDAIRSMTADLGETITAQTGDAVFMRPLLLHASSPARQPSHRRVLHLEFAPRDLLPDGLTWAET